MGKMYDVVVTQRYQSRGEEKKRYVNIGSVIETDRGLSLKLESIPVGWDGWAAFYDYEPKERGQKADAPAPQTGESDPFKDDLPF